MPRILLSRAAEAGLLAVLAAVAVIAIVFAGHDHSPRFDKATALSLAAAGIALAALAVRGRHAFTVLVAIAIIALAAGDGAATVLPLLVATFNVALRCDRRGVAAGAVLSVGALLGSYALHSPAVTTYQPLLSRAVAAGMAVAAGLYLAARRAYIASLQDRANQLEREQQLLTEHAVADERVRIARELHDVVAHGVSLMVVQAQALGALEGAERDEAGTRIATIGRDALTEMHRMLGVLRPESDEGPELAPAPGIRDVPSLIERARDTGLDVALAVEGEPRPLPAGVDLSAYRIVQEALTNVVRHSRARRTDISVRYALDALELTVVDDGAGAVADGGAGHGLVGMRERVALFGGTLETGRARTGGWSVRAVLPL
ncbi:MAG TPA: histidine kinase [Solirubrobacteraceae bacterium]|nr:histidine kinase [Solirubrobacteraceae bacterium]